MKKNSLATAIIAGAAGVAGMVGVANAVNLNPGGLGQVLIYPYYTVNGGNSTVITVVNTTDSVKAVKVRFVEALNSAEVYDFNLYLSPYDVWATNVVADGDTGARLVTTDTSCTVPNVLPGSFLQWEYAVNTPDALAGLGEARVRQGHLEIIEMGNIDDSTPYGASLAAAATHINGVPGDCSDLEWEWTSGAWAGVNPANAYMSPPSGGLFGGATIVSAEYGRTLSYNADAIDGFFTDTTTTLHYNPGTVFPHLGMADDGSGGATARIFMGGNFYSIDYAAGIDAVSAVLTSRYIYNEYSLNAGLDAASEWVITFPTKRAYVHKFSAPAATAYGAYADQPFVNNFPVALANPASFRGSCHSYQISYWDREERTTSRSLTVSPPAPTPGFGLCWEANVLAFGQTLAASTPTRILGATPTFGANGLSGFEFEDGWARIELDSPAAGFQYFLPRGSADQVLIGQPVTGFWASEIINNNVADGVRANFGALHSHRYSGDCRIHAGGTAPVPATAAACPSL